MWILTARFYSKGLVLLPRQQYSTDLKFHFMEYLQGWHFLLPSCLNTNFLSSGSLRNITEHKTHWEPSTCWCPGVPGLRQLYANLPLKALPKFPLVSSNTLYVFKSTPELRENKHPEKPFSWTKGGKDSAGIFILHWKQQNFHRCLFVDVAKCQLQEAVPEL